MKRETWGRWRTTCALGAGALLRGGVPGRPGGTEMLQGGQASRQSHKCVAGGRPTLAPQASSRGRFAGGAGQEELEDDEEEPLEDVSDSSAE